MILSLSIGLEVKRMSNIVGMNAELLCATLDDRERKLITGDSLGQIIVYNCLTGITLKVFPTLPYAVRQLIYSEDKTIIALVGQGDIFVFDELPNDADADVYLRDVRGVDIDVVAMAYYHNLGLIATADIVGSIMIYNYCDLSVVTIIKNITKDSVDIGQITFLEPLPLLLVTDSMNNFIIVPVGPAVEIHGRKLWRIDSIVAFDPLETMKYQDDHDDESPKELNLSTVLNVKPFSNKKKHQYLLGKREAKSISIHVDDPQDLLHCQTKHVVREYEPDEVIIDRINRLLEEVENITMAREKKNSISTQEDTHASTDNLLSNDEDLRTLQDSREIDGRVQPIASTLTQDSFNSSANATSTGKKAQSQTQAKLNTSNTATPPTALSEASTISLFPQNISVYSICGNDDGTLAVSDLTSALRNINVGVLSDQDHVHTKPGYDPRKIIQRQIKEADVKFALW